MKNEDFVRRLSPDVVVGVVQGTEGSAMHNTHSVINRIYVGSSREEIVEAVAKDYGISGDVDEALNRAWSSVSFYDEQSAAEAARQNKLDSNPAAPTQVRTNVPVYCVIDWNDKLVIQTLLPNKTTYTVQPSQLGVDGFAKEGDKLESGTVFTVPYKLAKFLAESESGAFEIVGWPDN